MCHHRGREIVQGRAVGARSGNIIGVPFAFFEHCAGLYSVAGNLQVSLRRDVILSAGRLQEIIAAAARTERIDRLAHKFDAAFKHIAGNSEGIEFAEKSLTYHFACLQGFCSS